MSVNIPYVISEAVSYYNQELGSINEKIKDTFFVEKKAKFIYVRRSSCDIVSVNCIKKIWENLNNNSYLGNPPWKANIFINGEWVSVTPSDIEIFEYIQRIKSGLNNDKEEINDNSEDVEEYGDYEFTEEETNIQYEMKQYMESELDNSDLEMLSSINDIEQIIYMLNKCIKNIFSEKYKSKKELFYKFFNIISKYTEKDINETNEKMKNNNDEKLRLKMDNLMNLYSSILEYKNIYNNLINLDHHKK